MERKKHSSEFVKPPYPASTETRRERQQLTRYRLNAKKTGFVAMGLDPIHYVIVEVPKPLQDWKDISDVVAPKGGNSQKLPSDEDDPRDHSPDTHQRRASSYWQQLESLADAVAKRKISSDKVIADLRDKLPEQQQELPPLDDADQFCAEPDDTPPEVIEGILHQGSKGELGGGSKTFKTWTLVQMSNCISHGIPWLGFNTHAGQVLYINFELPRWSIRKRIKQICTLSESSRRAISSCSTCAAMQPTPT